METWSTRSTEGAGWASTGGPGAAPPFSLQEADQPHQPPSRMEGEPDTSWTSRLENQNPLLLVQVAREREPHCRLRARRGPGSLWRVRATATPRGGATATPGLREGTGPVPVGLDLSLVSDVTPTAAQRTRCHGPAQGLRDVREVGPGPSRWAPWGGGALAKVCVGNGKCVVRPTKAATREQGRAGDPTGSPSCRAVPAAPWAGRAWHTRPRR